MPSLDGLIGIPFEDGGRNEKGLDCWGLFMLAQKRFGNDVPDFKVSCFDAPSISALASSEQESGRWERITEPEPGCAILFATDPRMPDMVNHVGVYLGDGKFLHTQKKVFSHTMRINDAYWSRKIRGFYRWARREKVPGESR